jgi:hypothetical protein
MAIDTVATQSYSFRDARGDVGRLVFHISYDSAVAQDAFNLGDNIQVALANLSNAQFIKATGPFSHISNPQAYGTTSVYQSSEDKLRFTWQDAGLAKHKLDIPAPKSTAFLADEETASGTALAPLITAMGTPVGDAHVTSLGGNFFSSSLGGQRVRKKAQRKETIYRKSANLDEPGE